MRKKELEERAREDGVRTRDLLSIFARTKECLPVLRLGCDRGVGRWRRYGADEKLRHGLTGCHFFINYLWLKRTMDDRIRECTEDVVTFIIYATHF